jgi:hypothetical protein
MTTETNKAAREARKPTKSSRLAKAAALVAGATLATLAGAATAAGQPQGQMARDLATRDRDIHWPAGFEPEQADLFAHNEARLNGLLRHGLATYRRRARMADLVSQRAGRDAPRQC